MNITQLDRDFLALRIKLCSGIYVMDERETEIFLSDKPKWKRALYYIHWGALQVAFMMSGMR